VTSKGAYHLGFSLHLKLLPATSGFWKDGALNSCAGETEQSPLYKGRRKEHGGPIHEGRVIGADIRQIEKWIIFMC
jgi:hypothetical protein